jgi:hypothetical protein
VTRPIARRSTVVAALVTLVLGVATVAPVATASSTDRQPDVIRVTKGATVDATRAPGASTLTPADSVSPVNTALEFKRKKRLGTSPLRSEPAAGDRVQPLAPGAGTPTSSGRKAKSNPDLMLAFEGLNHRDSRLVDDGNAYSGEPADQGLCVGNGYLFETVNSAIQVFDARTGTALTDPVSLNTFYGFPVAIDRTNGTFPGPFAFDISCHYDRGSNRWFHLMVDLEQHPVTGDFTGRNYLDLAVSTSGDPTGSWVVYRIPGMNDGTEGTPDHDCAGGPCFADFPHIGVDRNGVYITTNEFPLFADGFTGAQVYALSKQALVAGAATIDVLLYDMSQPAWQVAADEPGFTVWPALSAGSQFDGSQGGTQYFVSSRAVFDDTNGDADSIVTWALSNSSALSRGGFPTLTRTVVPSLRYAVPPPSPQKDGVAPLRDCLNDTGGSVLGFNCGDLLFGLPPQQEVTGPIDTSDSRVLDVRYANGKLWAVLGTAAEVAGEQRAGVGWFVLNPSVSASGVRASMRSQGILALQGESLAYPTIGVTSSGRGVIGVTAVGENRYPSYAYASLDAVAGVGPVRTMLEGQGVQDGFTEYPPIGGNRPRWGDYGAAAVDGRTVYLAGQYIAAPGCSIEDFVFTDCDGTRTLFANWSTAVGSLRP